MDDAKALMVVHTADRPAAPPSNLPPELRELYEESDGRAFDIERVRFRRTDDVRVTPRDVVVFADDEAAFAKRWMYHRCDDLVCSSVGECLTTAEFLKHVVRRELHQRAQNHLRYTEKCVRGRYVPSPELTRPHDPLYPVD